MIEVFGQPAARLRPRERRALGVHFVPEERLGRGAVPSLGLAHNLLLSMMILTNATTVLTERTVRGIEANEAMCAYWVERSAALATALMPHIGYARAAELVGISEGEAAA